MNKRRPRSDDVLFISALAALLLGLAFLLYTTGALVGARPFWPLLVMAAGGALLYLALVRGASFYILFGGNLFVLEGILFLIGILLGWRLAVSWPLGMATAGLAGLVTALFGKRGLKVSYLVPSLCFTLLGFFFALFSFGLARIDFSSFIAIWWPSLLIAGGICLFIAYGLSRRARGKRASGGVDRPSSRKRDGPTPGS
jgi:hypothetical protein